MEELVDQFGRKLWVPDKKLCEEGSAYLDKKEWLRKKTGFKGLRPSQLGIERYRWGNKLPSKFLEGSTPPQIPIDSAENIEWYEEQLHRCIYGFEYKGTRITGDHYWQLNFTPISAARKNKQGVATAVFDIRLPYYSRMHDYVFKLFEEAMYTNKIIMFMSARGSGKTYSVLSVAAKYYQLFQNSHSIISASSSGHANEAFNNKLLRMLDGLAEIHPTLALSRIKNTSSYIESGYEIVKDGVKYVEGPRSKLQKVIYGDNPDVTRGWRPDVQMMEEIGAWSSGKGNLRECIAASVGSWRVGPLMKTRVFMIGTGGSVDSDQALDIASEPDAFNILTVNDFKPKVCITLPAHYLAGGFWERTGINDNNGAKKFYDDERERTKADIVFHQKLIQEYPFNFDELFMKTGSNIFDQEKIATQWTKLIYDKTIKKPRVGRLEWVKTSAGKIKGVRFEEDINGHIEILEEPYHGKNNDKSFKDLYVLGLDSIDMAQLESTSSTNRSNIAALVKKRIVDGEYFSQTSNIYVAKYVNRSKMINTDYENVLKLAVYYGAKVNIEYTRTNIVAYFKTAKMSKLLMARPEVSMPKNSRDSQEMQDLRRQTLIGTTTAPSVIDHQDMLISEYINQYSDTIQFRDLLENLRDYRRNDRRKYDLVVAMGLCEIADEEFLGEPSKEANSETKNFKDFGYYIDANGYTQFGVLPDQQHTIESHTEIVKKPYEASWIDLGGNSRFDQNFDILNASIVDE